MRPGIPYGGPGDARPLQQHQRACVDQQVADAQHVAAGRAAAAREDVAEPQQVRVRQRPRSWRTRRSARARRRARPRRSSASRRGWRRSRAGSSRRRARSGRRRGSAGWPTRTTRRARRWRRGRRACHHAAPPVNTPEHEDLAGERAERRPLRAQAHVPRRRRLPPRSGTLSDARDGEQDEQHVRRPARDRGGTTQSRNAGAGSGGLIAKPCATGQPSSRSCAMTSSSSTPSATTRRPRLRPRSIVERTITALVSCAIAATNERSIFSSSTGQLLQVRQRRVAGPEVVDRQHDAHPVQLVEDRRRSAPGRP